MSYPTHDVRVLREAKLDKPLPHYGRLLAFYGTVLDVRQDAEGTQVQLMVQQDSMPELVCVTYPFNDGVRAVANDKLSVLGKTEGLVEGINAFGGPTSGLKMEGVAYVGPNGGGCHPAYAAQFEMWKAGTLFKH